MLPCYKSTNGTFIDISIHLVRNNVYITKFPSKKVQLNSYRYYKNF